MSAWTQDRINLLKRLWPEGRSAETIALELGGGVTRNAVLGKVARLELSEGRTGARGCAAGPPASRDEKIDALSSVSARRRRMGSSSRRATTTCPHTTPSDFVTSPRKSTAAPFPATEGKRPSAPVTAGDPAVAKAGVVAHGALRQSLFKGMVR